MLKRFRFIVALSALAAESVGALLVVACGPCPSFLDPGRPHRVVLLEPYTLDGTFTGADDLFRTEDLEMPSCGALDDLATTSPIVVPEASKPGGETCSTGASIAVDAPVAAEDNRQVTWGQGWVARLRYYANVETELAGCTGVWTFGMQPMAAVSSGDPFVDPVPGQDPPWVVVRSFYATAPCAAFPVAGATTVCADFFAARLEPVPR